jgi:quercetin dioxygenase-like cupin family protein
MPVVKAKQGSRGSWVKVGPGVEMRGLVEGEGTALVLYRIDPGVRFAPHSHRFPEYGTIIVGRGRFLLGGKLREVREGDSYYIPSGLEHGFESTGRDGPVVMLHVAVGLAAPLRVPMLRHLEGNSRSLIRRLAGPDVESRGVLAATPSDAN